MKIIIEARREGYSPDQIDSTMTVGELIEALSEYGYDTPVLLGHDRWTNGNFYTYGGITWNCFEEREDEEEEEDE